MSKIGGMKHTTPITRRGLLLGGCAAASAGLHASDVRPPRRARNFDPQSFVADCVATAAAGGNSQEAIQALMAEALSSPDAVLHGVGAPVKGGIKALYRSAELTILNIVWSPLMQLLPHEHNMWAVIGIYAGREDNVFWQRAKGGTGIGATTARAISTGEVVSLPRDVIHSVNNPIEKLTGAIHVYGGDFFAIHRSEWDPETLKERDWSIRGAMRNFEESNARFFDCRHM